MPYDTATGAIAYQTYAIDANGHAHPFHPHSAPGMPDSDKATYYQNISCDIKPRLTKEQHDVLEHEFQKQSKPNTSTKKEYAKTLGVSLDKVNNWFQNRRAKSKQESKKQAGVYNLFAQQQSNGLANYDSDTSPSFANPDFLSMMHQCPPDNHSPHQLAFGQHFQEPPGAQGLAYMQNLMSDANLSPPMADPSAGMMYDSPLDINRRTFTQEQFNQIQYNDMMIPQPPSQFEPVQDYAVAPAISQETHPEMQSDQFKQQDIYAFPDPMCAPPSSIDSTAPSTTSEHSMFFHPMSMSEPTSESSIPEYTNTRASSAVSQDLPFDQSQPPQPQLEVSTTSQWQPGSSVPVDPNAMDQHFRELGKRNAAQQQEQQQQVQSQHEQPLAWPEDVFERRDSQSSTMLAHQMSNFAIQTPQPPQTGAFKAPAPPTSIATRRQRPRPANLGLASLRSQSYNGSVQPNSPGQAPHHNLAAGQQLRRIRSHNVINGVATGRVTKAISGTAQRSPLNFTFAESLNSPTTARHASASMANLAPPTPLSPHEIQAQEQTLQETGNTLWQYSAGEFVRPGSITEIDADPGAAPFTTSASAPTRQTFSSPPHTPMYQQHPHYQAVYGLPHGVFENTPPQSAPASQQTFPNPAFMPPQGFVHGPMHHQVNMVQPPSVQPMAMPKHMMPITAPHQQLHLPQALPPSHQGSVTTSSTPERMQFQFANGTPMVNSQGQMTMSFSQPTQPVATTPYMTATVPMQQFHPSQTQYNFVTPDGISPMANSAHLAKPPAAPPAELHVHEYCPPQELKDSAMPRKPLDTGPKNYTFSNHGPEHFEKGKKGSESKTTSVASSSPGGSTP